MPRWLAREARRWAGALQSEAAAEGWQKAAFLIRRKERLRASGVGRVYADYGWCEVRLGAGGRVGSEQPGSGQGLHGRHAGAACVGLVCYAGEVPMCSVCARWWG